MRLNRILSFLLFSFAAVAAFGQVSTKNSTIVIRNLKDLPKSILVVQALNTSQGVCEPTWEKHFENTGAFKTRIDELRDLYLVPCAQWAHNMGWSAYMTLQEPSRPDGVLLKVLRFPSFSKYEGLVAQDLAYNIKWDPATGELLTRFNLDGFDFCGARSVFHWSTPHENFILQRLVKQDDCKNPTAPWKLIFDLHTSGLGDDLQSAQTKSMELDSRKEKPSDDFPAFKIRIHNAN